MVHGSDSGQRLKIRRIGPDGTTRYYHDGIRPIWEADSAGSMTAQLDRDIFGNLLSRKEPAGTRRYYHFDGLGSTTALSDEAGAAVATLLYDAWGSQRAASGATVPDYRFAGAELDSATGFYHMGVRFYDPSIGRWIREDPIVPDFFEPATLNFYSYVGNNPVLGIDPTGMAEESSSGGSAQTDANRILQWIADSLGITVAELIAMIEKLKSWLADPDNQTKYGGVLMAAGAVLSVAAVVAAGGAVTGTAAAVVGVLAIISRTTSMLGALATTIGSFTSWRQGRISGSALAFNLGMAWAGVVVPGLGASRVGRVAFAGGLPSTSQALYTVGWAILRAFNIGLGVLGWR